MGTLTSFNVLVLCWNNRQAYGLSVIASCSLLLKSFNSIRFCLEVFIASHSTMKTLKYLRSTVGIKLFCCRNFADHM